MRSRSPAVCVQAAPHARPTNRSEDSSFASVLRWVRPSGWCRLHPHCPTDAEAWFRCVRSSFVDRTTQTWSSKRELPQNSATLPVLSLQCRSTSTWWFVRSTSRRASRRSVPVAWSHDEPHDQSDQDEQQHAHTKPSERTHSISKTTHHGELLLPATGFSRTPSVSRLGTAFAARNHRLRTM